MLNISSIFSFFFLFLSFFSLANAAVMGVDFGSEFYKISMIAPGKPFVILENTFSQRKTPSAVEIILKKQKY